MGARCAKSSFAGLRRGQPFSSQRRGKGPSQHRTGVAVIRAPRPRDQVPTTADDENVPLLARDAVFKRFVQTLETEGYSVDYRDPIWGPASVLRNAAVWLLVAHSATTRLPTPRTGQSWLTVYQNLRVGLRRAHDPQSPHYARRLSPMNLKQAQYSPTTGRNIGRDDRWSYSYRVRFVM